MLTLTSRSFNISASKTLTIIDTMVCSKTPYTAFFAQYCYINWVSLKTLHNGNNDWCVTAPKQSAVLMTTHVCRHERYELPKRKMRTVAKKRHGGEVPVLFFNELWEGIFLVRVYGIQATTGGSASSTSMTAAVLVAMICTHMLLCVALSMHSPHHKHRKSAHSVRSETTLLFENWKLKKNEN